MKIGIIVGSMRNPGNSAKIGHYISERLPQLQEDTTTWTLDLGAHPLPLWDESVWSGAEHWKTVLKPLGEALVACDGFVVLAPEYAGMVPPALKNFFLLADKKHLGHKPGLIVAVSSGRGGSYPVAELRSSSYKNNRLNWIPDHVIVRDADHVLNGETPENDGDTFIRGQIDYSLRMLLEYARALQSVRASGVIDYKTYPNGM